MAKYIKKEIDMKRQKFIDDLLLVMEKHSAIVNMGDCECAESPSFGGPADVAGFSWLLEMSDLVVEASKRMASVAKGEVIPGLNRAVSGAFGSMLQLQFFNPKVAVPPISKYGTSDRLLLVLDQHFGGRSGIQIAFGRYIPGIKAWRIDGSPSDWKPVAWAYAPDEEVLSGLKP